MWCDYESPLGTRSFMRHIATQDFPVSPELTRDHFHTGFPLLSLGHVYSHLQFSLPLRLSTLHMHQGFHTVDPVDNDY